MHSVRFADINVVAALGDSMSVSEFCRVLQWNPSYLVFVRYSLVALILLKLWPCFFTVPAEKSKYFVCFLHSCVTTSVKHSNSTLAFFQAGNGADARQPLGLLKEWRGLAFQIGGDKTLEEHITVPSTYFCSIIHFNCVDWLTEVLLRKHSFSWKQNPSDVLKKFNPNVFGYSTGTGKWDKWEVTQFWIL